MDDKVTFAWFVEKRKMLYSKFNVSCIYGAALDKEKGFIYCPEHNLL